MKKILSLSIVVFGLIAFSMPAEARDRRRHRDCDDGYRGHHRYGTVYYNAPVRRYYYRPQPVYYYDDDYGYYRRPYYSSRPTYSFSFSR